MILIFILKSYDKCYYSTSGFRTRMLPLTSVIPKELLPINGKTNLDYILENALRLV